VKYAKRICAAALATGLVAAVAPATASAVGASTSKKSEDVRVVAEGLNGPFGLETFGRGFLVAENQAGQVTKVSKSGKKSVAVANAPGVAGVAAEGRYIFSVLGGEGPPDQNPKPTSLLRTNIKTGKTKVIAELLAFELKRNPDGQRQFDDAGEPFDALSNPFSMTTYPKGLLVADGGANDVLRVNPRTGKVKTFFVPKVVSPREVPACADNQANPGTVGCDPVPTGVAYHEGSVYVSTLGAEVPGAARIYKLDARSGKVERVWKGFTSLTGIAVSRSGTIYVSELLEGAPPGEPPPGFDPAPVGQITRIARHGKQSHAQVTMPIGLQLKGDRLFSTAWSLAALLGIPDGGQIVEVPRGAFH
jgi:hypothetical protein